MSDTPLDEDLVARILEKLQIEPTDQLLDMLTQPADGPWSLEALEAARLLLEQRLKGMADEPECRTEPRPVPTDRDLASQTQTAGDTVLAPGFSLPRGFSGLLFLRRLFGRVDLYPGKLGEIKGNAAYIFYYNGKRGWVSLSDVKPFRVDVGDAFYSPYRGKTGTVIRWSDKDEQLYLRYDDGQGEWLTLGQILVPHASQRG